MAIPNSRGYTADWVRIFPLPALVAYRKTNEPSQHNGEGFENTTIQPGHHPKLSTLINGLFDQLGLLAAPSSADPTSLKDCHYDYYCVIYNNHLHEATLNHCPCQHLFELLHIQRSTQLLRIGQCCPNPELLKHGFKQSKGKNIPEPSNRGSQCTSMWEPHRTP